MQPGVSQYNCPCLFEAIIEAQVTKFVISQELPKLRDGQPRLTKNRA